MTYVFKLTAVKTYYVETKVGIEASSLEDAKKEFQSMTPSELGEYDWEMFDGEEPTNIEIEEITEEPEEEAQ